MTDGTTKSKLEVGSVWTHKKTKNMYQIRSISTFSCDGELDGSVIVAYRRMNTIDGLYSTPAVRFTEKFAPGRYEGES
jgi:hypothetical protein